MGKGERGDVGVSAVTQESLTSPLLKNPGGGGRGGTSPVRVPGEGSGVVIAMARVTAEEWV